MVAHERQLAVPKDDLRLEHGMADELAAFVDWRSEIDACAVALAAYEFEVVSGYMGRYVVRVTVDGSSRCPGSPAYRH